MIVDNYVPTSITLNTNIRVFFLSSAGAVPDEKFPVMVWFHPGDFHWGTPMYWDASVLAARHKVRIIKHTL